MTRKKSPAIRRKGLSRPVKWIADRLILTDVLDWGCGRGDDVFHLRLAGVTAMGWDPAFHRADQRPQPCAGFDTVLCTYVANTLLDVRDRIALYETLERFAEAGSEVFLSVRRDGKGRTATQVFDVDPRQEHEALWACIHENSQFAIFKLFTPFPGDAQ